MSHPVRILALAAAVAAGAPASAALAAGDPDPSFGDGGHALAGVGVARTAVTQPDGRVLVVHDLTSGLASGLVVTRLTADGRLDRSWDGDGTAVIRTGDEDAAAAAALQPDGRLLVVGRTRLARAPGLAIARFDADGTPDETFAPGRGDGDGRRFIPTSSDPGGVVVHEDGTIDVALTSGSDIAALRLTAAGADDPTAFEPADVNGTSDTALAATAVPGGGMVIAGSTVDADGRSIASLVRYTRAGKLDRAFGVAGTVTLPLLATPRSVSLDRDGRALLAGVSAQDDPAGVVERVLPSGAPDGTFGVAGVARIDYPGSDVAVSAAEDAQGRVVVGGGTFADTSLAAARLTPAGVLDDTFGAGGLTSTRVAEITAQVVAADVLPDGRVTVVGSAVQAGPIPRIAVARFLGDPRPQPQPQPQSQPQPSTSGATAGPATGVRTDTTAPALTGLRLRATRRGTVTFTLSEAAKVRLVLQRRGAYGRFASVGGAQTRSARTGANTVSLGRRLRPGRYRVTATATDAAGNAAAPVRFTLRVR